MFLLGYGMKIILEIFGANNSFPRSTETPSPRESGGSIWKVPNICTVWKIKKIFQKFLFLIFFCFLMKTNRKKLLQQTPATQSAHLGAKWESVQLRCRVVRQIWVLTVPLTFPNLGKLFPFSVNGSLISWQERTNHFYLAGSLWRLSRNINFLDHLLEPRSHSTSSSCH